MKRIGTYRRKTRAKFTKSVREKGKISLTRYFQTFKEGERVMLIVEPSIHKGMYDPKYIGKSGTIKRKNGKCYEIDIKDGKKDKIIIAHPIHLKGI